MSTYTPSQIEPLARRLCQDLPGLHVEVARCWIRAESGTGNNPLGMTVGGKLVIYSTPIAGIDAAAARVKTLSYYKGIVASLDGGSIRDQALAIIASPWNAPGSPYYTHQFSDCGLLAPQAGDAQDQFFASLDAHQLHLLHMGARAEFQRTLTPHQLHLQHLMNTGA